MVKLPPSRANRWVPCPGSAQVESMVPDRDTESTFSGKKVHEAVAESLLMWKLTGEPQPVDHEKHGLDTLQRATAEFMASDVVGRLAEKDLTGCGVEDLHVEEVIEMPYLPGQTGRLDVGWWSGNRGRIIIWDLKSGFVGLKARDDWQTLAYAQAVLNKLEVDGFEDQHWTVEIRIVQPNAQNADRVDVYMATAANLRARFNQLIGSAERATCDDAPTVTGAHCFDCRGLAMCRTAKETAARVLRYADSIDVLDLSAAEKATAAANLKPGLKLLEKLHSALETQAIDAIQGGEVAPGWTVQNSRGRRMWNVADEKGAIDALALYGVEAGRPPALKALGEVLPQADRVGLDLAQLGYVKTAPGAPKLVPSSDGLGAGAFGGSND